MNTNTTLGVYITINDNAPDKRLKKIMMAIIAAIRWNGNIPDKNRNSDGDNSENIIVLAKVLEDIIKYTVIKKNSICIRINDTAPAEYKICLINVLVAAIKWYGYVEDSVKYNVDNVDGLNLVELANLIENLSIQN
jgi:hypothetical protein